MKKKFMVAAGATVLALSMSMAAMAAVPEDYEAYFTFDEKLDNEKGGSANAVEKGDSAKIGAATEKTFNYVEGKNGKAVAINDGETKDNIGLDTGVVINGADSFTFSFWAKANTAANAASIIWIGAESQSPESWIAYWAGFNSGTWEKSGIGSNDASGLRVAAESPISTADKFGYDYITVTVNAETHEGVLYYNGNEVARTAEGSVLPTLNDGSHIYVGASAWDAPADIQVDDLVVYKRVLSADEIKSLYEVNGVPKADAAKVEQEVTEEKTTPTPVTFKPNLNNTAGVSSGDSEEEEESSNTGLIIGVVVAVLVVAVVIGVVVATKKKSK